MHHFACLAGYGAEAINPYLAFETLDRDEGRAAAEARRQGGRQALHQGDRQGHPQGDVQDGHLDLPVLLRRADLRRGRAASRSFVDSYFTGTAHARSKASASPRSPRRRCAAIATRSATRRSTATRSTSAANMPSASAARRTCGRRDGRAAAARGARQLARASTAPMPRSINEQPSSCSPCAACSASSARPR